MVGPTWVADDWRVSGLTQAFSRAHRPPDPRRAATLHLRRHAVRSSDRALHPSDLRRAASRSIFYPFLLMTAPGYPWRGRITLLARPLQRRDQRRSHAFLGAAAPRDFTPDATNLTVAYSGSPTDYTYRRMILHYAWLCTIAGGVDLFRDRLGTARAGDDPRAGLDQSGNDRRRRATRSGTIRSSPA